MENYSFLKTKYKHFHVNYYFPGRYMVNEFGDVRYKELTKITIILLTFII